jgi:maltooligosyltrehalose synthase
VVAAAPVSVVGLVGGSTAVPLGQEAWGDACLRVPAEGGARYVNVLTGEEVGVERHGGRTVLPLHAVFATWPVALLRGA